MVLRPSALALALASLASAQGDLAELERRLGSHDSDERSEAVRQLARSETPAAVQLLVRALDDESAYVRDLALQSLVDRVRAPELGTIVLPAFRALGSRGRLTWAFGLGEWRAPLSLEALGPALKDREARVREAVLLGLRAVLRRSRTELSPAKPAEREAAEAARAFVAAIDASTWSRLLQPLLRDRDRQVRATAVEVLAAGPPAAVGSALDKIPKDRDAFVRLAWLAGACDADPDPARAVGMLADAAWQVRVEAAQQLGRLARRPEQIDALLERWGREPEGSPAVRAFAEAANAATGMRFGERIVDWQRWWQDAREGWTRPPGNEREEVGAGAEARTEVAWHGLPVEGGRVVFVLDNSGSMRDPVEGPSDQRPRTKRDLVEREFERVLEALPNKVAVDVILFADEVEVWKGEPVVLRARDREELRSWVAARPPRGRTNLLAGVLRALAEPEVEAVYLLSDGAPSVGEQIFREDVAERIAERNRLVKARVHTAALLGAAADAAETRRTGRHREFLAQLAADHGGRSIVVR